MRALLLLLALALAWAACGAKNCIPGDQKQCACLGGTLGVQVCSDNGQRYEACQCGAGGGSGGGSGGGGGSNDAGADAGADAGEQDAGPQLPFASPCMVNGDCASMLCGLFPTQGASYCTRACNPGDDCADAGAQGCYSLGYCRVQ